MGEQKKGEVDLRSWFAGHALQGMLANVNLNAGNPAAQFFQKELAAAAFSFADAMMAEKGNRAK